jgi:hypothetical protein
MTHSQTIRHASAIVRAILAGQWTNDPPSWADYGRYMPRPVHRQIVITTRNFDEDENYTRAVQTAEAFIILFRATEPTFNESAFLRACQLAPLKGR